jgi:hypothetical protein
MRSEITEIPEVSALTAADFEQRFLNRCQPVVVRGSATAWPALERWDRDYLRAQAGDLEVPTRRTPLDQDELSVEKVHQGFAQLSTVLDECDSASDTEAYVPGIPLKSAPALLADIERPAFLDNQPLRQTSLFLGQNTRCLGHMHPVAQAVLTQVAGEKEIVMYAPHDLSKLYMHPVWDTAFFQSRVNFHALDADRFPRIAEAQAFTVRLQPGDSLFIPVHWLHVPTGFGWTLSVTHWWRSQWMQWTDWSAATRSILGAAFTPISRLAQR